VRCRVLGRGRAGSKLAVLLDYPAWIGWEYAVEVDGVSAGGVGVLSQSGPALLVYLPRGALNGDSVEVAARPLRRLYPA